MCFCVCERGPPRASRYKNNARKPHPNMKAAAIVDRSRNLEEELQFQLTCTTLQHLLGLGLDDALEVRGCLEHSLHIARVKEMDDFYSRAVDFLPAHRQGRG